MSRATRAIAFALALGLAGSAVTAAAAAAPASPSRFHAALATGTTEPPPAGPTLPTVDDVAAAFAAGGVGVTPIDAPTPGDGIRITDWQAANLARQAAAGAGLTGLELRDAFPVANDGVPVDAIVAAWLITQDSAGATAARSIMPVDVTTISDPSRVVYPWAVIVLFVDDLARAGTDESAGLRGAARAAAPASGSGVCGALSEFYTAMKSAIIDALEEIPIIGTLAELAVQLFEQILGTAVKPLLAPIQLAITALGVAGLVAHIVDPWVFFIDKEPLLVIDYGIAPGPGNPGSFTARIEGGAILEWPAALTACAQLAGVQLPDLDPNGASVTWTPTFGAHATVTSQQQTLGDDGGQYTATLEYISAVEPAEVAAGDLTSAPIQVSVTVQRPEDQQLGAVVEQIVGDALSGLPGPVAQILASLAGSAIGSVAAFNDPSGSATVAVRFHVPPPPTTTSTSAPTTTTPTSSCIGRILHGVGRLQGATLELRTDGTWTMDFSAFPPQEMNGVVVVFSGQWIGTWTLNNDGTGFVIVSDLNSPFTASGTYQGITINITMQDLIAMFAMMGAYQGANTSVATCANGAITTPAGEAIFS